MLCRGPDVRISGLPTGTKAVDGDGFVFAYRNRDSHRGEQAKEDLLTSSRREASVGAITSMIGSWATTREK